MSNIFISYSSEDRDSARRLAQALEQEGWSVWWDRKIAAGKSYQRVIEAELEAADCVIVIWSAHSVASDWVVAEAAGERPVRPADTTEYELVATNRIGKSVRMIKPPSIGGHPAPNGLS